MSVGRVHPAGLPVRVSPFVERPGAVPFADYLRAVNRVDRAEGYAQREAPRREADRFEVSGVCAREGAWREGVSSAARIGEVAPVAPVAPSVSPESRVQIRVMSALGTMIDVVV